MPSASKGIGRTLLSGDVVDGSTVVVDHAGDGGLTVSWTPPRIGEPAQAA